MAQKKITTHSDLWKITQHWLLLLGNKINTKYCREELTSHPDYPAMTAVADFLDAGSMQYQAVQADASYINEFNYPLLAHIRQPGQEYMHIIPSATEWDNQKEITQYWTGIAIFPQKGTRWQNEEHKIYQKNSIRNSFFTTLLLIAGLGIFIVSSIDQKSLFITIFGLLSVFGLIISVVLSGTEMGYQSQIVKQVCGAVSSGGCEKVLKSKYAKGVLGITPADGALMYFSIQLIFYLLSPYQPRLLSCILLMSLGGIAISIWSIYTQGAKLKQWCALCLGVAAVLIMQATIAIITPLVVTSSMLLVTTLFLLSGTFLFFAFSLVKQLIKINYVSRLKLAELRKWKNDAGLFINQWQQEPTIDTTIFNQDLILGNPGAPLTITVACNPYCDPCAQAHAALDDLLHRFGDVVKLQIRFLCGADHSSDKRAIAVKAILQNASVIKNNADLQQMLTDWFEWMDLDKWVLQWPPDSSIDVTKKLEQHQQWIAQSEIKFTPTLFLNQRKLPGRYSIRDLEILLPQLSKILQPVMVK